MLVLYSRQLRVISPPTPNKDLRDWIAAGAIRQDLERTISTADVRRLHIRITTKGAK